MSLTTRTALARTRLAPTSRALLPLVTRRNITIAELDEAKGNRERVLVLGSGWAGYTLGRDLDYRKYQPVIVSPRNYFTFTPLLASTSVGTLEFRTALEPVRRRNATAAFFQGWADSVDLQKKTIEVEESVEFPLQGTAPVAGNDARDAALSQTEKSAKKEKGELFTLGYDKLCIAVGCYSQTFNTPGVREHAHFLKDVGDARRIRNRLLSCFEIASLPTTSSRMRDILLNFAVVGGGPTGIEWSAELRDIISEDMSKFYPELYKRAKITVYDVAPTVLSMFDEKLAKYAANTFKREGIDIKTSHHITALKRGAPQSSGNASGTSADQNEVRAANTAYTLVTKEDGEIGCGMCVWSTGLMMNPFVENALKGLVKRHEKSGAIMTDERLQVQDPNGKPVPDVFALGDCAILEGSSYPATAQVANQKARWLAKRLNKGDIKDSKFTFKDMGIMAYIGNWSAILQSSGGDISGRAAWFVWRGAYLAKSMSWRNRLLIPYYWLINWMFGRDISRF